MIDYTLNKLIGDPESFIFRHWTGRNEYAWDLDEVVRWTGALIKYKMIDGTTTIPMDGEKSNPRFNCRTTIHAVTLYGGKKAENPAR